VRFQRESVSFPFWFCGAIFWELFDLDRSFFSMAVSIAMFVSSGAGLTGCPAWRVKRFQIHGGAKPTAIDPPIKN